MSGAVKRWDHATAEQVDSPQKIESFLDEIENVCHKFGYSISHEDGQGGFLIVPLNEARIAWLREAAIGKEGD